MVFGFGKKQKTYSIEAAAALIERELEIIQHKNKAQLEATATRVRAELQQLRQLIKEFDSKPTPEFAVRSENVKYRFCTMAMKQLDTEMPTEPGEFLRYANNLLNTIGGLTQRQILHINMFFKDDFAPVGRKLKDIEQLLKVKESGGEYMRVTALYQRIKAMEKRPDELDEAITTMQEKVIGLNRALNTEKQDSPQHPENENLERTRKQIQVIKQEIDSFLPVQKLLKKYAYAKQLKDPLINEYINSPSAAILNDDDLEIIQNVSEASKMFHELSENKRDSIVNGRTSLQQKKEALEAMMKQEREQYYHYEREKDTHSRTLSEKNNRITSIEQEIKETQKQIEEAQIEIREVRNEFDRAREEFRGLAQKLLDVAVEDALHSKI